MKKILYLLLLLPLVLLSQEKKKKILDTSLLNEIEIMFDKDQLYRSNILSDRKHLLSEVEWKTLWKFQFEIDDQNTRRIIEIVKEYGYVDHSNSNIEYIPMISFFLHAPKKYTEEIKSLIDKERKKGNVDGTTYDKIISHLKFSIPENLKMNYKEEKKNDSIDKQ